MLSGFFIYKSNITLSTTIFQEISQKYYSNYPRFLWSTIDSNIIIRASKIDNVVCLKGCIFGALICSVGTNLKIIDTSVTNIKGVISSVLNTNTSAVVIERCRIINISATTENAIGRFTMGKSEIISSFFSNCRAEKIGLFYFALSPIIFRLSQFINNTATKVTKFMYVKDCSSVVVSGCYFEDKTNNGGVDSVFFVALESNISIDNTTFLNGIGIFFLEQNINFLETKLPKI